MRDEELHDTSVALTHPLLSKRIRARSTIDMTLSTDRSPVTLVPRPHKDGPHSAQVHIPDLP